MRNFCGRGKELIEIVNVEAILFTKSSRLLDTHPLRAFIITSTMGGVAVSMRDGRLKFHRSGLLGALLPSSLSGSPCLKLSS